MSDSATPWTTAHQAPLSMRFSRQEYWNGLPFPSPGVLPNPGLESRSPALQADSSPSDLPRNPSLLGGVKMSGPLWSFPTSLCSSPCEHFHCITICFSFLWLLWQIIALGGLRQQKYILAVLKPRSLKLVSRSWNQGLSKTTVLLESPRGKSAPCLFQLMVEVPHARVYGHIPPISGSVCVKSPLEMCEDSCDGIEGPPGQSRIIAQLKILNLTHM